MKYLIEKYKSSSDRGSLDKGSFYINKVKSLVKTNTSDNYEAFSECLGSRIFKFIGDYPVISYSLIDASIFEDYFDIKGDFRYLCYSNKYKYKLVNFMTGILRMSETDENLMERNVFDIEELFELLKFDFNQFYFMLVGDALIGNEDRHMNNFDFYYNEEGDPKLAPILDFGRSMLYDVMDSSLDTIDVFNDKKYDRSEPLSSTHKEQIEFIKNKYGVRKVVKSDYESFKNFILNDNEDLFSIISDTRALKVKEYLLHRYKVYVEQFEIER